MFSAQSAVRAPAQIQLRALLDRVPVVNAVERMRLAVELGALLRQKVAAEAQGTLGTLQRLQITAKIGALLVRLGAVVAKTTAPAIDEPPEAAAAFQPDGDAEILARPRVATAQFFDFDPNRKHAQRKRDNAQALALLAQIDAGEVAADALTAEQKTTLARYSGTGGNLQRADGLKGSAYEYYTPKPIAQGMWDLLAELGFKGGKVLDPCAGVGIFGATAPASVAMQAVELDSVSGRINQLVNGGPGHDAVISPFEAVASQTPDESFDAVVTNVPFGDNGARGRNRLKDERYQDASLETYFILRSLEKLKPGGLATFIVPPRVVSGKGGQEERLRTAASHLAEFMGAYRLPNSVFGTADADTITDVIVLRKFGREAATKIAEAREQAPATLTEANVLWSEFIGGEYFKGEGTRFVLGEFVAKNPAKVRDVDRVVNGGSVADIAKLLRKFPGSRIDWAKLNATETEPIVYNDGDTLTMAGQTLQLREGQWVALPKTQDDSTLDDLGQRLGTPLRAVDAAVRWDDGDTYVTGMRTRSQDLDLPDWLRGVHADVSALADAERSAVWNALVAGLAAVEVLRAHAADVGFNYAEEYPKLSDALQANHSVAKRPSALLSRSSKQALEQSRIVYSPKHGFSAVWRGDVQADVTYGRVLTPGEQVDALKYRAKGVALDVTDLKAIYGDAFDPLSDDDWCVSADGKRATRADDYYVGNLGAFLALIDAEISAAEGPLRDKLLRQKTRAIDRVQRVNPGELRFNLFSPFVSLEEKAEYLRRFMHPAFTVAFDNDGEAVIICDISSPQTERERQLKRFAEYLKRGNLSTRTREEDAKADPQLEARRRKMLRDMAAQASAQFDQWVKSNPVIMERLRQSANDPASLYFTEVDDSTPLAIGGLNPELTLHGYQNAYVRRQGRKFGGINGFDVGLGKTFTALAATQYVQGIGVKKKTMFIVPGAVLSNWRREASRAYESTEDCLFVGLSVNDKTGDATVDPANYARDFARVLENRHAKIFCTMEAFKSIPLKHETIEAYEQYLAQVDPSFDGGSRTADAERADGKLAEVTAATGAKSSAVPFFEDMGVDSLVIDEAHAYKNSKQTVDFSSAKFLSVADASQRGLDIQIKAWFVRGLTPMGDGVLALTATPITNSPLEIYSMLCLAVGERKVHSLCMGARGADAFMEVMCNVEDDDELTIDGRSKNCRVFKGLQNVELLRRTLGAVATIKKAKDVKLEGDDLRLPEAQERKSGVQLPEPVRKLLAEYKDAYYAARYLTGALGKNAAQPTPAQLAAASRVQERLGESMDLIAHPFNLINKMSMLIADPELDERATFYTFAPAQADAAQAAVTAFNKLGKVETRARPGPHTAAENVVGTKSVRDGDDLVVMQRIRLAARIEGQRIVLDTMDYANQMAFEVAAEKAGLVLEVGIPPKLAALLENFKGEEAQPRSLSGRVKQLIFCDMLPLHNKIKRLLTRHAGVASSAIAVISGQSIKDAEQMQAIQDGFNAEGKDNRYRTIIGNDKAEVGINLQKGTQAIHHLTIGWTPDSQIQRNGRGVRQGNTTGSVAIYHYDADGTFDAYKRRLTSKKGDWIDSVMAKDGGNEVAVSGGLTAQEYDELIESMGDGAAIEAIRTRSELKEKLARAESAQARQVINLRTAGAQQAFLQKNPTAKQWVEKKVMALYDVRHELDGLRTRTPRSPAGQIKLATRVAELTARVDGLRRDIEESAEFVVRSYSAYSPGKPSSLDAVLTVSGYYARSSHAKQREVVERNVRDHLQMREAGPLQDDWASEVAAAQKMMEEALADFARVGDSSVGSYPAGLVEAFKEGQASIMDGKLVARGMLLRDPDGKLAVVDSATTFVSPKERARSVADVLSRGWTALYPGGTGYDEAVAEAARLDDAVVEKATDGLSEHEAKTLFSTHSPDVASRRTTKTLIMASATLVELPAPLFAHPINPDGEGLSAFARSVADSQASAIVRWEGHDVLYAFGEATVLWQSVDGYRKMADLATAAAAAGEKLNGADLQHLYGGDTQGDQLCSLLASVRPDVAKPPGDDWKARIEEAAAQSALDAVGLEMAVSVYPWYEVTADNWRGLLPSESLRWINQKARQIQQQEAAKASDVGEVKQAQAAPLTSAAMPKNVLPNSYGSIGVTGNTMAHKDRIKYAAQVTGKRAYWNGKRSMWEITPAAWDELVKLYPQAAQELQIVPA
ncbi:N-6 DNA methylase [Ideonella sp.]|uniref:N-6 DNA methylase n=1 Tax=Ideonella sp. TaxID=1929293 RepID=UPI0035AF8992